MIEVDLLPKRFFLLENGDNRALVGFYKKLRKK